MNEFNRKWQPQRPKVTTERNSQFSAACVFHLFRSFRSYAWILSPRRAVPEWKIATSDKQPEGKMKTRGNCQELSIWVPKVSHWENHEVTRR